MTNGPFSEALISASASEKIPPDHRIFEPLIGSWDLFVEWFDEAGEVVRTSDGEWHFSRVLEGRAVQDVWIVPPRSQRSGDDRDYEYGTSIRFYDASLGAWRSTWIGPARGWVMPFLARRVGDELVLENPAEHAYRWTFSHIEPESFSWRNELKSPEGEWGLQQTFRARRKA
jgi:hypothetical protein